MTLWEKVYNRLNNMQIPWLRARCLCCTFPIAAQNAFCEECERSLPRIGAHCWLCLAPLPDSAHDRSCGACLNHAPAFDRVCAPYRYARPVDQLIIDLKYRGRLALAPILASAIMTDARRATRPAGLVAPKIIVPMPLHPIRLIERGYNQSREIAHALGRLMILPVDETAIIRTRNTAPQATLAHKDRVHNMRNAFAPGAAAHPAIKGQAVALIDDVLTSGQTAHFAARALKKAGASSVEVWVVARAGEH